jgi:hypothetical protein
VGKTRWHKHQQKYYRGCNVWFSCLPGVTVYDH